MIAGNGEDGIYILDTPNAEIQGNVVGLGVNGVAVGPDGNSLHQQDGITIEAAPDAKIGGSLAGERNVVSNSLNNGVYLLGPNADRAKVQGNYIGTDLAGESFRDSGSNHTGNRGFGVMVLGRADNTPVGPQNAQIGGSSAGQGNVISGNAWGVGLAVESSANKVQGNLIGTDKDGTDDLGNANEGISVQLSPNNDIGGTAAGEGNVISANAHRRRRHRQDRHGHQDRGQLHRHEEGRGRPARQRHTRRDIRWGCLVERGRLRPHRDAGRRLSNRTLQQDSCSTASGA